MPRSTDWAAFHSVPRSFLSGLSAPTEVEYHYTDAKPFTIIAYLENSGGFDSRGTSCALVLPDGLKLAAVLAKVDIGLLKTKETRQLSWSIVPTGEAMGATLKIKVEATSENLETNNVEREILVKSPPQLALEMSAPEALSITKDNRHSPNPFEVKATVANLGAQPAINLVVELSPSPGLDFAGDAVATQVSERLDPGSRKTFTWSIRALGLPAGKLQLSLQGTAAGAKKAEAVQTVMVPELTPEIRVYPEKQTVAAVTDGKATLLPIAIKIAPAKNFRGCRFSLSYDPQVLEPLYVSRGDAFVEAGSLLSLWSAGKISEGAIINIGGERGDAPPLNVPESALCTVVFLAKGPGETAVTIDQKPAPR